MVMMDIYNLNIVVLACDSGHFGRYFPKQIHSNGEIAGVNAGRFGSVIGNSLQLRLVHARENFANGAMRAARWLVQNKKKAGLYSMAQVLGL